MAREGAGALDNYASQVSLQNYQGCAFKSQMFSDEGEPVVKASDIKSRSLRPSSAYIPEKEAQEYENVRLKTDDLLMSTVGSTPDVTESAVGQLARVPEALNGAYLNQNTVRLEFNSELHKRFAFYALQSESFRRYLDLYAHGTANQSSLSLEDILQFPLAVPTFDEQVAISNELDRRENNFVATLERAKLAINLFRERRIALISAAVTGKIDVRDWKPPAQEELKYERVTV